MIEQGKKLPISTISELYVISNNNQWREYALCQEQPYELYFPQKRKNKTKYTNRNYYEAQELCLHCPVKFECLAFAVSNKLSFGTFCLPATERKKIKITTDLKSFIKKVVQRRDIMETKFNPDGSLLNKRCVQCHRKTKHFYFDAGGWSALRNQCVDCAIEIQQNKKSYHRRYSESNPKFDEWGVLISKVCTKCKERNKADQYAKRVAGIGGRTSWCRKCVAFHTKQWEIKNKK